jgi:hypothetical protein
VPRFEPVSLKRIAELCLDGKWSPYDVDAYLWAIRRADGLHGSIDNPTKFVSDLIDAMNAIHHELVRGFGPPPTSPGCYFAGCASPKFGCQSGDLGGGYSVRHVAADSWMVADRNGATSGFESRVAAESACAKAAALDRFRECIGASRAPRQHLLPWSR